VKNFKNLISYVFLIIFLFVFYSYVKNNIEVLNEINSIQVGYIGIFFVISYFNYVIKAKINMDLYSFSKIKLSIFESLRIVSRSTAINLSGPANIGAGYKLHYLKKKYNLDIIENFSINIAYVFYLNYFYIVIIFLITLLSNQNWIEKNTYLLLFLFSIIVVLFLFFKIISLNQVKNIKIKIFKDNIEKLLLGFQYLRKDIENTRKLIISSIAHFLISIIYWQIVMYSAGFNITLYSLAVLYCLSSMVNLIKLTPGNIGFLEVSLIFFQGLHGITTNQIIIYSVVTRIVSFLTILFLLGFDKFTNKN
jgi:uncharacterized protein (TIRG00374 family)